MLEVTVKSVVHEPVTSRNILVLEGVNGGTLIPINVGLFEAEAIYNLLNRIETPRPMTYDFIGKLLSAFDDVSVEKIIIDDLEGDIYTAKLYLHAAGNCSTIDCRPSDAIALGIMENCPIFVEDKVISHCGCEDTKKLSKTK